MASIINDPNGRKRIEFNGIDGKRRGIRLGKASLRDAIEFKSKLEYLTSVKLRGASPDADASKWLASLPDKVHKKLASAGLSGTIERAELAIGPFAANYITGRTDAKPATIINLKRSREHLCTFFGESKNMQDITEADAEDFSRYLTRAKPSKPGDLQGAGLGMNTARRICGRAKQFFRAAMKRRILTANPFDGVKCRVQASVDREYFITREEAAKVIAACPDAEWRLIFALSRFAGLRCPSEHLALKWSDVDWKQNRFTVHSPKTEHHEGKAFRIVPIFPELRPYLAEACKLSTGKHVIATHRDSNVNLRTQLYRIIKRAGLKPWPKLFHNLRSTRETELAEIFPIHVVCYWLGNSAAIAKRHYLQVTDDHYSRAATNDVKAPQNIAENVDKSRKIEKNVSQQENDKVADILRDSSVFPAIPADLGEKILASEGQALCPKTPGKTHNSDRSDVKNATPDFEQIKNAWATMPAKLRAQILKAIGNSPEQGT